MYGRSAEMPVRSSATPAEEKQVLKKSRKILRMERRD
jgi:hypothetical protein